MKILLLSAYFPPEIGSASHLFYELGENLVARGHHVSVVTGFPRYNLQERPANYRGRIVMRETMAGMVVHRWPVVSLPRRLMVGRALDHFFMAASFLLGGLAAGPHEVVMAYSPPLPLGLSAWLISRLRKSCFVLNVQDLFPQSIIDLGLLKNKFVIRAFQAIERFLYRHADAVTVHSPGNREHVIRAIGRKHRLAVIPNWVDMEAIVPGERMNGFREEHELGDAFVVSFAGVLGYSQDLDIVLDAASLLNHKNNIVWLIVGDGVEKPRLEAKAMEMGLKNVRFLPMQSRDNYPAVLNASDVCLTTLHAEVKTPVVPSKILSIMASGRPVVAALNPDGDAPRLISEARCGVCVPPENAGALAEAVLRLSRDEALRTELGRNGRRYAEEHLSLDKCTSLYEKLLIEMMDERSRK